MVYKLNNATCLVILHNNYIYFVKYKYDAILRSNYVVKQKFEYSYIF